MAGNTIGTLFRITTWGESHGEALGVVIDGCPPGILLNEKDIQTEVDRRRPQDDRISTPRKESDTVHILSGVFEGKTTGMPISIVVWNENQRSKDYAALKDIFRPGHADFTYAEKYGYRDYRGGGRSSGRETICRVMAGAVAKKILTLSGTHIYGFTTQIGDITAKKRNLSAPDIKEIEKNAIRCADPSTAKKMISLVERIRNEGDSIGGCIRIHIARPPKNLGEPVFDKIQADIGKALFSIQAVKGVSFGEGFNVATMKGSENNDVFASSKGKLHPKTNHAGGLLGGITTGEDIVIDMAIKPASSIGKTQKTATQKGKTMNLSIEGRHDACIVPRVIPVAESMVAITLVDHLLRQKAIK